MGEVLKGADGQPLKDSTGREIRVGHRVFGFGMTHERDLEGVVLHEAPGDAAADLLVAVAALNVTDRENPVAEVAHEHMQSFKVAILDPA